MNVSIVGGSDAKLGQFPYQALLTDDLQIPYCGGSIISARYILTAAHCVEGVEVGDFYILVGLTNRTAGGDGDKYEVEDIIVHEGNDPENISNDISLIKLKSDIKFSDNVQIAPLRTTPVNGGEVALASGWGIGVEDGDASEILQYVAIKVVDRKQCREKYSIRKFDKFIHDNVLCAGGKKKKGTCKGDSGGPLAVKGELVGVVSWGIPCALGYPDVFASVYDHLEWIKKNIN